MRVTFVCTGNICRSPMAELIARHRYGATHTFDSSGTWAMTGWGMTEPARTALREIGIEDHDHRARAFEEAATADEPDAIYVMTTEHLDTVVRTRPDLADRAEMLDPDGRDIADPYGGSLHDYRRARDLIAAALDARFG